MTVSDSTPPLAKQEALPFPLQDGEQVLEVCRRHWVYLWPSIAILFIVAVLPPVAIGFVLSEAGAYEGTVARIFWVAAALWFAFWAVRIFLTWYRYHNDVWVVTNQRLIDSFKPHPFDLRISSADLVSVQDMTIERSGLLRTLLDYGDIVCETAADNQDFRLPGIPNPRRTQA